MTSQIADLFYFRFILYVILSVLPSCMPVCTTCAQCPRRPEARDLNGYEFWSHTWILCKSSLCVFYSWPKPTLQLQQVLFIYLMFLGALPAWISVSEYRILWNWSYSWHVDTGNQTWVLWNGNQSSKPSLQPPTDCFLMLPHINLWGIRLSLKGSKLLHRNNEKW